MFSKILRATFQCSRSVLLNETLHQPTNLTIQPILQIHYRANELWKSVLSVSSQGSKKGRGKRRGATKSKDLNLGQQLGDGKLQVIWPGLNTDAISKVDREIKVIGVDENREKKLIEIRNKMDKFKKITIFPHERGFTGGTLNGKSIGAPISYDDVDFSQFDTRIFEYKTMISHKSILGKKKILSCFAVTGNRNGIIGYGLGKGTTTFGAIKLAKARASQRLLYFERFEDRTLFHNFYEEYYYTKIYAEKMPPGYGLVCHRVIKKICELVGIKDLYAKIEGSRNPKNITKAFLSGLLNQKKYQEIAEARNLNVVEYRPDMDDFPMVLGTPSPSKINEQEQSDNKLQRNINLYLFGNKHRMERKVKLPFYYHYDSYKTYCKLRDLDKARKKAKIERMKLLPEETLITTRYPLKPKPKAQGEEQQAE